MNLSNGTRDLMLMMAKEDEDDDDEEDDEDEDEEEEEEMVPMKEGVGHQRSHSAPISPSEYATLSTQPSKDFAYIGGRSKTNGAMSPPSMPLSASSQLPSINSGTEMTDTLGPLHQLSPTYSTNSTNAHHR